MSARRLAANAASAAAQVALSAVMLFILYRFLLGRLGAAAIGTWSLVLAVSMSVRLAELGMGTAMTRYMAADFGEGRPERAAATLGLALAWVAGGVGLLAVAFYGPISWALGVLVSEAGSLVAARRLLPWALATLWAGSVGSVLLAVLDACQRTALKALISTLGTAAQLGMSLAWVPARGLEGLAIAQMGQSALVVASGAVAAAACLGVGRSGVFGGGRDRLRELLRFGGTVHAGSLGQILFDPAAKAILARFGGLGLTGYYETASRIVTQFRAVLVSATETLLPYFAHRAGMGALPRERIGAAFQEVHGVLFAAAVPYFAVLAAACPLLPALLLGRTDPDLARMGLLCTAGWGLNTLSAPAYLILLAAGKAGWTAWMFGVIGGANVVLGILGGAAFGGFGAAAGSMTALVLGNLVLALGVRREFGVGWRGLVPPGGALVLIGSAAGAAVLTAAPLSIVCRVGGVVVFALVSLWIAVHQPPIGRAIRRLREGGT